VVLLALIALYLLRVPVPALGFLRVFLFYTQTAVILVRTAVAWPAAFAIGTDLMSQLFGFSPEAVRCTFASVDQAGATAFYMLAPVGIAACVGIIYIIGLFTSRLTGTPVLSRRTSYLQSVRSSVSIGRKPADTPTEPLSETVGWVPQSIGVLLFLLDNTHFVTAVKAFDAIGCTLRSPSDGQLYLGQHSWLACASSTAMFPSVGGLGAAGTILWAFGLPVVLLVLLVRARSTRRAGSTLARIGFLYAPYKHVRFPILLRLDLTWDLFPCGFRRHFCGM
jgi:hypothetical protein